MYADFFGLRDLPFRDTPDPRFLYPGAAWQATCDALLEAIRRRRGLLALVGPAGSGKTLLLRHLTATLARDVRVLALPHPGVSFDEIVDFLARHPAGSTADASRNAALMIDEAQAIPEETLDRLPELLNGGALQILLAGQPPLDEMLSRPVLRERLAIRVQLAPLSDGEVSAYVRSRLAHAGASDVEILSSSAVARIARLSEGEPRLVNVLCDASLRAAFESHSARVTPQIVDQVWAGYEGMSQTTAPEPPLLAAPLPLPLPSPAPAERPVWRMAVPAAVAVAALSFGIARIVPRIVGARSVSPPATQALPAPPPPVPAPIVHRPAEPEPAAAPPPVPAPSATEALDLVDRFRLAYESRDVERLRSVLAPDVFAEVASRYTRDVDDLATIDYIQPTAVASPHGDRVEVEAPFVLRYRDRHGATGERHGIVSWEIARRDGETRIVSLRGELLAP